MILKSNLQIFWKRLFVLQEIYTCHKAYIYRSRDLLLLMNFVSMSSPFNEVKPWTNVKQATTWMQSWGWNRSFIGLTSWQEEEDIYMMTDIWQIQDFHYSTLILEKWKIKLDDYWWDTVILYAEFVWWHLKYIYNFCVLVSGK